MDKSGNIILIPTDFSEVCQNAIDHGSEIAKSLNYEVCLLHAINSDTKSFLKKEKKNETFIEEKLSESAKSIKIKYNMKVSIIARDGDLFDVIQDVGDEINASLLMLGTHGKVGMQRLTGSYASKVVLNSKVPVIVVQERSFGKSYKDIVFPVNHSDQDRQKVKWAVFISKIFGSRIHILKNKEANSEIGKKINLVTNQIKDIFDKNSVLYTESTTKKSGDFDDQVLHYAVSKETDLIMIMTQKQEYAPSFLLGPWDEKMMFNKSQIPVMCVNPRQLSYYVIGL